MPALARRTAIARHRADMELLLAIARRVAPRRRGEPVYRVWTLPDLLAHVAAWDRWLLGAVDELLADRRPRFGRTSVFNKHAVDASRAQTYAEIVRDVRGAHTALMARLERLSDEEWSRQSRHRYHWGDKSPITVASLFAYTYQGRTHYGGHAAEIEAWLER
jgi:uncharacterized damage-inducible protein DinB